MYSTCIFCDRSLGQNRVIEAIAKDSDDLLIPKKIEERLQTLKGEEDPNLGG